MSIIEILSYLNQGFTFFVIFPAVLLLGVYLTFRLKFIQFSALRKSIGHLFSNSDQGKGITHYQAVASVLAGNFGTGNISGIAVAITTGGPGALVWMWVIALLGATIQYASCVLGVHYRKVDPKGEPIGGPMYYLRDGLGLKKLGAIFALFAILGGLTAGNFTQVNSVALPLSTLGVPPLCTGLVIAFFVGLVLLGGLHRFAKISASIVPIMALLYMGTAASILTIHSSELLTAIKQMLISSISPSAFWGGGLGYGLMKTISSGFDRGIFATDAGTGLAPMLQSSTKSSDPIASGVSTLIAPVLVMIVCTMTGLVLLVTGAADSGLRSTNMVTAAFSKGIGSEWGGHIVILALLLFSYTTVLAWASCAERAACYLFGYKWTPHFRWFFIAMVPIGALFHVEHVWVLADLSFSLMLATNMVGVTLLSKQVIHTTFQRS